MSDDLLEVEFTTESGLKDNTDPIVTRQEAEDYREDGDLVISDSDGKAMTLGDFWGDEYKEDKNL